MNLNGGTRQYRIRKNNTMKGFKPLTLRGIKKRHSKNPQDKKLHETIEKEMIYVVTK